VFANTQEIKGWLTTCFQNINSPFLTGEQKLRCLQLVWGYVPTPNTPDLHSPLTFGNFFSLRSLKNKRLFKALCADLGQILNGLMDADVLGSYEVT